MHGGFNMQDHQILVDALHNTVARLRSEEVKYQWGHMGQCNAGHLVQSLTGMSDVEIVESIVVKIRGNNIIDYSKFFKFRNDFLGHVP